MMAFSGILTVLIALAMWLAFDANLLLCLVCALLGAAVFALSFLKGRKITGVLGAVFLLGALVCLYFTPYTKDTHPVWEAEYQTELAERKRPDKASARLEELLEEEGNFDCIHVGLVLSKLAEGKFDEACDALDAIDVRNSYYYYLRQLIILSASEAKAECPLLAHDDDHLVAFRENALEAMKVCPDWAQAYTMYGMLTYEQLGDPVVGSYCLASALSWNEKDGTAWYWLGRIAYFLGNTDEAAEYFENAVKYRPVAPFDTEAADYLALCRKEAEK